MHNIVVVLCIFLSGCSTIANLEVLNANPTTKQIRILADVADRTINTSRVNQSYGAAKILRSDADQGRLSTDSLTHINTIVHNSKLLNDQATTRSNQKTSR